MTVSSSLSTQTFNCNGSTTVFTCPFRVLEASELVGYLITVATNESVLLVNGTDFSVTRVGSANAIATTTLTYASDYRINFRRRTRRLQSTDYRDNDPFPAESHENALDRLTHIAQENDTDIGRALLAPEPETGVTLPSADARAGRLLGFDSGGGPIAVAPVSGSAAALALDLASSSASKGASLVVMTSTFAGEAAMDVTDAINGQPQISVLRFMTDAQRADYLARTAVNDFASALDLTTPIQTAIYTTYAAGVWLFFPDGAAKVTGLEGPTTTALYEDRGDTWRMFGAGGAQPFVRFPAGGAVIISDTDAPVFRYRQRRAMPTAGGNTQVHGLRFEQRNAAATSPVVLWDSLSENAGFTENAMIQFGLGGGFQATYQIKGNIERNFALCGAYFTGGRSAAGIGFNIPSTADAGMLTVRKNTARCFFWGYVHGDGTNDSSGALFEQNESSDCVNGMWNRAGCTGATFSKSYTEGITGTCILDEGTMTTITGGMHYLGFTVGIDASTTSNYGTLIEGNYLETAGPGCTLIKLGSGGPSKAARNNHLLFSTSGGTVTNVIGLELTGLNARLDITGNAFLPRGAWIGGAGTVKILNSSTGGMIGSLPLADGTDNEIPSLLRGAVTYQQNASTLTQANVVANVLTLPQTNVVNINASGAATVNSLAQDAQLTGGARVVHLVTANNNMTFADTATLLLNGAFTGSASGGILTLLVRDEGGTLYGREIARTSF